MSKRIVPQAPRPRQALTLLAAAALVADCATVLGEYTVKKGDETSEAGSGGTSSGAGGSAGSGAGIGGAGGCARDDDCNTAAGEGCDDGRCARRCFDDDMCPALAQCFGDFCTEPLGTPCEDDDDCGYTCLTLDANALPVAGYCSQFCVYEDSCPAPYECIDFKCYQP